jgi:GNAT superfamily N-acetyltransferase
VPNLAIRPYEDDDEQAVLGLLGTSLGKTVDDRYRAFFRWKHLQNPFGRSFMWVAEADGELAGFRSFLRWRFVDRSGNRVEAVRAVDTATHPDFRGLGVFRELTMHALDEMRPAGVAFVFNTPNEQSRPGYLKMGWQVVGRVPVQVRPLRVGSVLRMARARTAAELWSQPSSMGTTVSEHVGSLGLEEELGPEAEGGSGHRTDRTPEFLRWRYEGFPPVAARAVPLGGAGQGFAVVRLRRRGPALEATVDDVLPVAPGRVRSKWLVRAARQQGCDYLLAGAASPLRGFLRTERLGPVLTWRPLGAEDGPPRLDLSLGDLELF